MKITNKLFTLLTLLTLVLAVAPFQPARALLSPNDGFNPKAGSSPAVAASVQIDIHGPAGSGAFGTTVTALPNGNFVVTDPNYSIPSGAANVGAVYLYDGPTLTVISTLTGSTASDNVGNREVAVLTNGNYVVRSPFWNNPSGQMADAGAVTWCSATTGCTGVVSASNSLVGRRAGDMVGISGVTVLTNGNYVVGSSYWDNPTGPIADAGAVTWCSAATGCTGVVSVSNSLIGGTASDGVGFNGVVALTNGNYVVSSPYWDNSTGPVWNAGAVTWGNGAGGTSGLVTASNSLIGGTAGDYVGMGVAALTNGNYVVGSSYWDNPTGPIANVGAATWGNGAGGTVGLVTPSNSLIGGTAGDFVGGTVALTNGNYAVSSPFWDNPTGPIADVGAVTWGNGTVGTVGLVTSSNSLVGGMTDDTVSSSNSGDGVKALTNGNYVVASPYWDNPTGSITNVGAVTWGNGTGGTVGLVTSSNSLIGGSAYDYVGINRVEALTNGNYVVTSPDWSNPTGPIAYVGAVTWGNGMGGTVGLVAPSNSLIGGTADDNLGFREVTALTNGNYVVATNSWDNPTGPIVDVGAVTWGNGTGGTIGFVTSSNSLIGGTEGDGIGGYGAMALTNGNYVVLSPGWNNPTGPFEGVGAVTWGDGNGGTAGLVTPGNSLVGGTTNDNIGLGDFMVGATVTALVNGNYVVQSNSWDSPIGPVFDAGAVTIGNGSGGTVGLITSTNSVLGTVTNDVSDFPGFSFDPVYNRLIVGRSGSNIVTLFGCPFCTTNLFLPLVMR